MNENGRAYIKYFFWPVHKRPCVSTVNPVNNGIDWNFWKFKVCAVDKRKQ